jgi:hypothetical protein
MPGEFFVRCPKCGHGDLEARNASVLGAVGGLLERLTPSVQGKK